MHNNKYMRKIKNWIFCNHETTFSGRQKEVFSFIPIVLEDEKEKKSIVSAKQIFEPFLMVDNILFRNLPKQSLCRSIVNKKYQNVFFLFCASEQSVIPGGHVNWLI